MKKYILILITLTLFCCTQKEKASLENLAIDIELENADSNFLLVVDSFLNSTKNDTCDIMITLFSNIDDVYFWISYVYPKLTNDNVPLNSFNLKGKTIYINSSLDELFNEKRKDFPWEVKSWYVEMKLDTSGWTERYLGRSYNIVKIDTTGKSIYNPCGTSGFAIEFMQSINK